MFDLFGVLVVIGMLGYLLGSIVVYVLVVDVVFVGDVFMICYVLIGWMGV